MVSTILIILFSAAALCQAVNKCAPFTYDCNYNLNTPIAQNICGTRLNDTTFEIASEGCFSNSTCTLEGFMAWVGTATTLPVSSNYSCTLVPVTLTTTTATTTWTSQPCQIHEPNKYFQANTTLVTCTQDTDCTLADGTSTTCVCVLRGDTLGVCQPSLSNDNIFGDYWKLCGTTNTITDQAAFVYWNYYYNYWTYTQTNVSCINIFQEIHQLALYYVGYAGAAVLATGALSLLVFIN